MITVEEALQIVLKKKRSWGIEMIDLVNANGRVLAEAVLADRDIPAFDRVTMDGIAISFEAYISGKTLFKIEAIQAAGSPQATLQDQSGCIEVMTGAILPFNTDTVIPYEQCEISDGVARLTTSSIRANQNIHRQGSDALHNHLLLQQYSLITPAVTGLLASVGYSKVPVLKMPAVVIFSTGEELVDIDQKPEAHQVRRSNVYTLQAALLTAGITVTTDHLPDQPAQMKVQIQQAIKDNDVVLFSGAVSKGKFDFLPQVLADLQMELHFHKVAQKPGKPLLFGSFDDGPLVFGFPGNPISTFVCYKYFFEQWLQACLHQPSQTMSAVVKTDVTFKPPLTYHLLVTLQIVDGRLCATPIDSNTSGDLVMLAKANGLLSLPANKEKFSAGEVYPLIGI